ncbi:SDR family oxidoreductase [Anaeromyxobacter oryzisoli]|uniref:SDR family oxidoreductase n=1 Tax=Anaeromyxobacter oryzisoli TaxID=2925408 RepID=UPI001F5734C1|nr:NAD(P)H-binding protein [Anaeromyxobacter sp. SG63]
MPDTPARRVLVTGGTGTLGRHVVTTLARRGGAALRVLSRRERPPDLPTPVEWSRADLLSDALEPALRDIHAVLHLASAKGAGDPDVGAARRLLAAAIDAGVRHLVFVSIIGCDRIPLPFYGSKVRIEAAVRASGVPWSIVRVAQFHSLVDRLVRAAAALPVPTPIVADLRFQPVDEREVAERLVEIALGALLGDAPEIAGPEVATLGELAATWLSVTGRPATLVPVSVDALGSGDPAIPSPAPWARAVLEGYRAGWNTPRAECTRGRIRFGEWLAEQKKVAPA